MFNKLLILINYLKIEFLIKEIFGFFSQFNFFFNEKKELILQNDN
jgi:hypothetical protein